MPDTTIQVDGMTSPQASVSTHPPPASTGPPMPPPAPTSLLDLPPEIIDIILIKAIRIGQIAIMRTCAALYSRTTSLLPKNGVFHISVKPEGREDTYRISPPVAPTPVAAMAQHVNIDATLATERGYSAWTISKRVEGVMGEIGGHGMVMRKTCHVVVRRKVSHGDMTRLRLFVELTSFDTVTLEVVYDGRFTAVECDKLPKRDLQRERGYEIGERNISVYKFLERELSPTLGPAVWHIGDEQGGRYLEFRPREFLEGMDE